MDAMHTVGRAVFAEGTVTIGALNAPPALRT